MKKTIAVAALLIGVLAGHSQSATANQITYTFCLTPSALSNSDSVSLTATFTAYDGPKSITWSLVSGPAGSTPTITPTSGTSNMTLGSVASIHKMVPGTYVFQAVALSSGGVILPALKSTVTVLAPPKTIAYIKYSDSTILKP